MWELFTDAQVLIMYYGAWGAVEAGFDEEVYYEAEKAAELLGAELDRRCIPLPEDDGDYRQPVFDTPPVRSVIAHYARKERMSRGHT